MLICELIFYLDNKITKQFCLCPTTVFYFSTVHGYLGNTGNLRHVANLLIVTMSSREKCFKNVFSCF